MEQSVQRVYINRMVWIPLKLKTIKNIILSQLLLLPEEEWDLVVGKQKTDDLFTAEAKGCVECVYVSPSDTEYKWTVVQLKHLEWQQFDSLPVKVEAWK